MKKCYLAKIFIKKAKSEYFFLILLILVTAFLLYDLLFNVTCFFPEECHFFVLVVTAVLYSHVIMATISEAFSNITSLYIPPNLLNSLLDNSIMYKSI